VGAGWSFLLLGFLPFEVKLPVQKPLALGALSLMRSWMPFLNLSQRDRSYGIFAGRSS